jgi:eukaryotic-like serine/threonine-protein kinase
MNEARLERIGRYAVLAELGCGAMGVVYKARDPQLDRLVAIKTVRRDLGLAREEDAELRKRVYQEATAAGRLTHPNIVAIHDVIEFDGIPYIVMEYVEGPTLADLIAAEGSVPPPQAVRLVIDVCHGLEYAHGHGVIHRDIKPSNILVTASGTAKLSDFGIARVAGSHVTRTGAFLGTPAYMAPEQLRGRALDGRSDIFALGVTLYEALTGVPPFQGEDLAAVLYQVVHGTPVPLSERNPAVPRSLEAVTERALAKDPQARPATARAFGEALTHAMTAPADPGPKARSRGAESASPSRRPRIRAALVAVACLTVAGVGGGAVWARWPPERPVVAARPSPPAEQPPGPAPATPSSSSRSLGWSSPPEVAPAAPVAASRPIESDRSASPAMVPSPSAEAPAVGPTPVEKPAPPTASSAPMEAPPKPVTAASPAPTDRSAARQTPALGSISVATDPSVEVFVDGEFRGRTEGEPLVVPSVLTGRRLVTLRLGSREQLLLATVHGGHTTTLTYHFPSEPTSAEGLRETLEKKGREAGDKLREGVGKAQREVFGALRDLLDKAEGNREGRGRDRGRQPEQR